ncbi:MAG: glutamine synthetase [Cyclobacteriaceae bacterium]|jgi:glutamine synthetase
MAHLRFAALEQVQSRKKVNVELPSGKISDYFGVNSFGRDQMREALSSEVFNSLDKAIKKGKRIDIETAQAVSAALKTWAMGKGITHYTHWFQPLTGATAEKHDSFFNPLKGIEEFQSSELVQQEPDASSFPSGGIRSTFEARGYTAWDPSSPIFIIDTTLCIPTIFVAYTGESLDYKAPLLKSIQAISDAATKVCKIFDRNVSQVIPNLGWEQEYFVVDRALYFARPDLILAGRTVFGHDPARGQQLDDHYFGAITPRVFEFIKDFEVEAHKIGIPIMTRHNEVAPGQFECAPMFEEVNKAIDHNQLLKDVMDRVALKHDLKVLFHEKPFAGLNGSGKHNNWSLQTDTGINLFKPSNSARENLQFLVFFVCTIKAVYEHADLLSASAASAGNDHRLGSHEAPPAITSVFIGEQLTSVLNEMDSKGDLKVEKGDNIYMKMGIDKIPEIILDNTDRNRTSPFAFTGDKFEFRAVGSDANVSNPMMVLNVIVADQLEKFHKTVSKELDAGRDKRVAIVEVLREYIKKSKSIRFEGDGYSEEWFKEAKKRKLNHAKDTPRALDAYLTKKTKDLFRKNNILSELEIEARHEIMLENYIKKIQIESRLIGDLSLNHIIPTAISYQNKLILNAKGLKEIGLDNKETIHTVRKISEYIGNIKSNTLAMTEERKRVNLISDARKKAIAYCDDVKEKYFNKIRYSVDKLELYVDDEDWPLVKYRELLFLK